ncbi:MAG: hypothetical protein CMP64_04305 [Flavobacteriales bacterium]|nr:hypothetical protein [Flavobacteriales bacterium]|tara:strand:+ start:6965 stop:7345 length:381 start_codon:yes stop_codon:yes gene_type:complete
MKTKVSLSIVGIFNVLMALIMAFTVKDLIPTMLNTDLPEAVRMVEIMHYGLFPAILTIGLICLLCKDSSLEVAKKILISYIIGTTILMFVFFSVFAKEPLMNFGFEMVIPDIIVYIISIVGYLTAK